MELNTIYHGDCLELMHDIPDASVDMILCDLPYGQTACAWDSVIPFEPLWAHYKRVIKPRGAIVLTANDPFTPVLQMSNFSWYKYKWTWDKLGTANFAIARYQPLRATEDILIFGNGSINYFPQMRKGELRKKGGGGRCEVNGMTPSHSVNNDYYPTNIIRISNANFNDRGLHPTQKPVDLFAYLIRTYTNPGELVLDNCIGSGTTAIAAIETGRNWIGIEQDAEYYRLACERIEARLAQPFLPGVMPEVEQPEQLELL